MTAFVPEDDRRHAPDTAEEHWSEAWLLDLVEPDLSIAASFELLLHPASGTAGFHASIVGADRRLVTLSEMAAAIPAEPSLELRAPALWAEVGIQTPMSHVTVDLEAFGVALDDPEEVFRGAYGDRIAVGCELEWEMESGLEPGRNPMSYEIGCAVRGEILLGTETIEVDGWGWRSHRWGVPRADDRAALLGKRRDGSWWKQLNRPIEDVSTIARAPVAWRLGLQDARLDQRVVRSRDGDIAWVRSLTV